MLKSFRFIVLKARKHTHSWPLTVEYIKIKEARLRALVFTAVATVLN